MDILKYNDMFLKYASAYGTDNEKIKLKVIHQLAVANVIDKLADDLNLSERMKELAHITGIFHDLGRFEQLKIYNTYSDEKSIDHAEFSAEMLKKTDFLNNLSPKEREMVLTAIRNHNKLNIEPNLDEETLLLCKMIRDADKSDIYRVFCQENPLDTFGETPEELANDVISSEVYDCIFNHVCVSGSMRKNPIDKLVGALAFSFDTEFSKSFEIMRQNKYYRYWFDRTEFKNPETKKQVEEILTEIEKYIDLRLDGCK